MTAGATTDQLLTSYARLRGAGDVLRSRTSGRRLVVGARAAQELLAHPGVGAVEPGPVMAMLAERVPADLGPPLRDIAALAERIMTQRQGEEHARCRRAFAHLLSPAAVRSMTPAIADRVARLLDDLRPGQENEFMSAVAFPLAAGVAAGFLGVPEEEFTDLHRLTQQVAEVAYAGMTDDPAALIRRGHAALTEFRSRVAEWCAAGPPAGSVLAAWLAGDITGIDAAEFEANFLMLVQAGLETTAGFLGSAVRWLLGDEEVRDGLLRDMDRVPAFVQEALRYEPPLLLLERQVLRDFEYGGHAFTAPEIIAVLVGAVNHDPERFPSPETLDVGREQAPAFTFGWGAYRCLGAQLATKEAELLITALLRRFPATTLAEREVTWRRHIRFRMPATLRIVPRPAMTVEEELVDVIGERDRRRPLTSLETTLAKSVLVKRGLPVPDADIAPQPSTIGEWVAWASAAHPAR